LVEYTESNKKNVLFIASHGSLKGDSMKIWEFLNSSHPSINSIIAIDPLYSIDNICYQITNNKVKLNIIPIDPTISIEDVFAINEIKGKHLLYNENIENDNLVCDNNKEQHYKQS